MVRSGGDSPDSAGLSSADSAALTLGADYTFGVGNGLHVLGEYFVQETSREMFGEPVMRGFLRRR